MNYGERLSRAREYAKITQAELSARLGKDAEGKDLMSQSNISALERDPKTKGSLHTVKLAKACGVNPEWLAYEEGEMIPNYIQVEDKKLMKLHRIAQELPEFGIDKAIKEVADIAELIKQARAQKQ